MKSKTHLIDCVNCNKSKTVKVTVIPGNEGVNVVIERCKVCKEKMTMDEVFPNLNSEEK